LEFGPDITLLKKSLEEADISALYHDREIDRLLIQLVDFLNPVRQALQRKPGSGEGYLVRKRTSSLTSGTLIDVIDTDALDESVGDYTEVLLPYKTIGAQGKVSRRVQKTGRSIADLLREEMERKAEEIKDAEEFRIFWGNSPTVNIKQWDGLNKFFIDNSAQIVALTNSSVGVAVTTEKLDEAIDLNIGNPRLMVTSRTGRRKINALLQGTQRFVDRTEIAGGFRVISYNDIPIVASTNIPDVLSISTGGTVTSLTGGSTTSIVILDLEEVFMSVLTELTVMPLAKTSSQFDLFDVFMDEVLVVRDPRKLSAVTGLKAKG
jgi:hypothetical protein